MPELPDLEVFSIQLKKHFFRRNLQEIVIHRETKLNKDPQHFKTALTQTTLQRIKREGKEIHFHFSNQHILGVHLMLKGGFDITEDDSQIPYKILSFHFEDHRQLVLSDPQGLLTLELNPAHSLVPDALSPDFTPEYLRKQLKKYRCNLKGFLIDQKVVRGIGNAYADEILWESRIAPESITCKLPNDRIEALHQAVQNVLAESIVYLIENHPHSLKGENREFLKIHNPKKENSPTGKPLLNKKIASKTTYYSEDQVFYK
jgi:formamidopyrimidine-DNA glycosylase